MYSSSKTPCSLSLQYFARKCQAYHSSLQAAVKSKASTVEVNDEQAKLRSVALKITANINLLIRVS